MLRDKGEGWSSPGTGVSALGESRQRIQDPHHTVEALNRLASARTVWDDTRGINEHETTALRLAEERSPVAQPDTEDALSQHHLSQASHARCAD